MNHLSRILKSHYNIDSAAIVPQQGGWAALAYKVTDSSQHYFLKVYEKDRSSTSKWTALIDHYVPIIVWLGNNSGLQGKLPQPLPTISGAYKCEDDDGIYLLYRYIDGQTIGNQQLNMTQVRQLAGIIAELHGYGANLPLNTAAIREDFEVSFLQPLSRALDEDNADIPQALQEMIRPWLKQLRKLTATVDTLAAQLKHAKLNISLCHTDIHNWNLMQSGQQLMLIDWEGLKLAPVEADMMSLVDKPYYDDFIGVYQSIRPEFAIHSEALQFYRARRKLEDIWEFMEQLLYDKQDDQARMKTLNSLRSELQSISF
ncbi:aminoglycoside phosphotransferase family protein [Paenibacillaceae bacterium]|nr:aminoglycoside phosphotransferase family protein [Paenibacillaceae bacterium]